MKIMVATFNSPWGMGRFTTDALKRSSHKVELFYTNSGGGVLEKVLSRLGKAFDGLRQRRISRRFIKRVRSFLPEVVLIIKGDELLPVSVEAVKELSGAVVVNWLPDNPVYQNMKNILDSFSLYDHIFSYDRGLVKEIQRLTDVPVHYLPLSCAPQMHNKVKLSEEDMKNYACDVCFVGTWDKSREEVLSALSDYDLGLWGFGWDEACPSLRQKFRGHACGREMVKAFNAAKIVVNIHAPQTIDGANLRTFEACACSALQIVDKRESIKELFEQGREIEFYEDIGDLRSKIDYYLANPDVLDKEREAGYKRAVSQHVYEVRLADMLAIISKGMKNE